MALENDILSAVKDLGLKFGEMTINDYVATAEKAGTTMGNVVVVEEMQRTGKTEAETLAAVKAAFDHNNRALDIGLSDGNSYLLGTVGNDLTAIKKSGKSLLGEAFLDDAVIYTLGSQVGNHEIGLEPCAGTGDSCGYTGLARALLEHVPDEAKALRAIALMVKIGTLFRVGKTTTGCNMEGFGRRRNRGRHARAVLPGFGSRRIAHCSGSLRPAYQRAGPLRDAYCRGYSYRNVVRQARNTHFHARHG